MHQVIHAIVDAQTKDDALGVAQGCVFDRLVGATVESSVKFDYYITFEEDARVVGKARCGELPVAARLDSDEGCELLVWGEDATKAEFERNLANVRESVASLSDEEIMTDHDLVRFHCGNLGTHADPPIHLYDEFGNGIRTFSDFAWVYEDLEDIVGIDLGENAEMQREHTSEGVDEEIKELVFVYFVVCLLA